jgi:Acyl-CoA dehydrogenase, C-terminal, bacterial type
LTAMMFLPSDEAESLGRLERTLATMIEAEPAERKLRRWIREHPQHDIDPETRLQEGIVSKIITEEEAELLRQAQRQQWQVIQVDDFSPDNF